MKERLYLATDRQLEEKARETMKDEAFFASLRTQAATEKNRLTVKAKLLAEDVRSRHKAFLTQVSEDKQQVAVSALSDLEKKRERSKSGLVGALVRQGVIQKKHVNADDGSLDIAALSETSYFKNNVHLLEVLATYQLSKKSKLRQEAGEMPQTAVSKNIPEESVVKAAQVEQRQVTELLPQQTQSVAQDDKEPAIDATVKPLRKRRRFLRVTAAAATTLAVLGGGVKAVSVSEVSAAENASVGVMASGDLDTEGWDEGKKRPHHKPKKGEFHVLKKEKDQNREHTESDEREDQKEKKHRFGVLRKAREAIRSQRYTVKSGDTLWDLAEENYGNGERWPKIAQANCRTIEDPDLIRVGQNLRVPEKHKGRYELTYIVKPGDTLFDIARRKCSKVDAIVAANPEIKDKDLIYPKQVFAVPVKRQPEAIGGGSFKKKDQGRMQKQEQQSFSSADSSGWEPKERRPAGAFTAPLPSCEITSGYGMRFHPVYKEYKLHTGLDMAAPEGTRVGSIASGRVEFAGWTNGYGNTVIVDHPGPLDSMYGHLSGIDTYAGERVHAGEQIGRVGTTGISTGPHLHLETRVHGVTQDPLIRIPNPC